MKETIKTRIAAAMPELIKISEFLYLNPEEGFREYKAQALLSESLRNHGFKVDCGIYDIATAFSGTYESNKPGGKIAFLCEYDSLPGIGHGCGHNLISAMGLGAAIGLKAVLDEIGGAIVVLGTPGEETSGAKVAMVKKGAFTGITAALIAHPNPVTEESGGSLALHALEFEFTGKAAHAAQSPEKGINALEAVILLFNGVNALRQHVSKEVRIHGIIAEGGITPNIVPDRAVARFYVRAPGRSLRDEVTEKVIACGQGGALSTGTKLKVSYYEESYDHLRTNTVLSQLFNNNLRDLGEQEIHPGRDGSGSLDMGDVSNVVPAIHPWIGLGDETLVLHTKEFASATMTQQGQQAIYRGACAMAMTGYDVLCSKQNQALILECFESHG
jgi:amidohydrolase